MKWRLSNRVPGDSKWPLGLHYLCNIRIKSAIIPDCFRISNANTSFFLAMIRVEKCLLVVHFMRRIQYNSDVNVEQWRTRTTLGVIPGIVKMNLWTFIFSYLCKNSYSLNTKHKNTIWKNWNFHVLLVCESASISRKSKMPITLSFSIDVTIASTRLSTRTGGSTKDKQILYPRRSREQSRNGTIPCPDQWWAKDHRSKSFCIS